MATTIDVSVCFVKIAAHLKVVFLKVTEEMYTMSDKRNVFCKLQKLTITVYTHGLDERFFHFEDNRPVTLKGLYTHIRKPPLKYLHGPTCTETHTVFERGLAYCLNFFHVEISPIL